MQYFASIYVIGLIVLVTPVSYTHRYYFHFIYVSGRLHTGALAEFHQHKMCTISCAKSLLALFNTLFWVRMCSRTFQVSFARNPAQQKPLSTYWLLQPRINSINLLRLFEMENAIISSLETVSIQCSFQSLYIIKQNVERQNYDSYAFRPSFASLLSLSICFYQHAVSHGRPLTTLDL